MIEELSNLDRAGLVRLAEILEAGLLAPPFRALALRQHLPDAAVEPVSTCLNGLARKDMSPAQIALVLRAFAAARQPEPSIDLVVSGPDVPAAARDTGVVTRQLFGKARKRVLAVGFVVRQGRTVFEELARQLDADASFEATLCIDVRRERTNASLGDRIVESFAKNFVENEWPGVRPPRLYYDPRSVAPAGENRSALHAKCVVVDGTEALVTSANFTAAAQERNIELGLLVRSRNVAERIETHFRSLIREGYLARLPLP